jgi:hypothetical protein
MKSFLLSNITNTPNCKWGLIPPHFYFEGKIPKGYDLAVSPTDNYIVVDVDKKNGKNGFTYIDKDLPIFKEMCETYHYYTASGGGHFWFLYTGNKILKNCSTKYGIDLRIGAKNGNCGGYVKFHPASKGDDIRNHIHEIKETSSVLNVWLEELFS